MSIIEIGCCCAYCRTCRAFRSGGCPGCRLGYEDGGRDAARIRCAMKSCCVLEKRFSTCAYCPEFETCPSLRTWYAKPGWKYGRYLASAEYIRAHGYDAFLTVADGWTDAIGRLR
jgi:hypothetical protein